MGNIAILKTVRYTLGRFTMLKHSSNWAGGASPPSLTTGTIFSIYVTVHGKRAHLTREFFSLFMLDFANMRLCLASQKFLRPLIY